MSSISSYLSRPWPALAALLSLALHAAPLQAASCHGGGGGQTIVSLPSNQDYQLAFGISYRSVSGQFGATGVYEPNGADESSVSRTALLGAAYRLAEDWQLGATLPVITSEQAYRGKRFGNTGAGDPILEVRHTFWDDVLFLPYRPGLELSTGVKLPLGKSSFDSTHPYSADVTGDGITTVHLAASLLKRISFFRLSVEGTLFRPLARTVERAKGRALAEPYSLVSGPRYQLQESVTVFLSPRWTANAGLKQLWQAHSSVRGERVAGSAARAFSTNLGAGYMHDENWTVGVSFETLAPLYRYEANQPNFNSVSVTASYGAL